MHSVVISKATEKQPVDAFNCLGLLALRTAANRMDEQLFPINTISQSICGALGKLTLLM